MVNLRCPLVFHRNAQRAVPDGHVLDDGRRGLANADALVRAVMDQAGFNKGIERALAQIDAVAVEPVKRVNDRVAHHAVIDHVVINRVGVGLVVADEGAAVDETRAMTHVDQIARDVGVQGAVREGDLAVLGIHRVAVVGQQLHVIKRHIGEPRYHRRPVVHRMVAVRGILHHGVADEAGRSARVKLDISPWCVVRRVEAEGQRCFGRAFGDERPLYPQLRVRGKPDFYARLNGERHVRQHGADAGRQVRRTVGSEDEVLRDGLGQNAFAGRLVARHVPGVASEYDGQWVFSGEDLLER